MSSSRTGWPRATCCPACRSQAKKGHLLITDRYPGLIRHQLLELGYIKSAHHASGTSVAFNAQPRPTGQLLIGSSRQFDTLDPAVEMNVLGAMLARAARYLPDLPALNAHSRVDRLSRRVAGRLAADRRRRTAAPTASGSRPAMKGSA